MDETNIEVRFVNGNLMIKGEKEEEKEEKKKDYYVRERHFGPFKGQERVDADKMKASFKKGVLTITLPKKPEVARFRPAYSWGSRGSLP